jgi:hypothetical protein
LLLLYEHFTVHTAIKKAPSIAGVMLDLPDYFD